MGIWSRPRLIHLPSSGLDAWLKLGQRSRQIIERLSDTNCITSVLLSLIQQQEGITPLQAPGDNIHMRQPTIFETIANRLLNRRGIAIIWQLHLRASASHLDGNWLAAAALIGIADAAERQWAGRSRLPTA